MRALPQFVSRALEERGRELTVLIVRLGAMGDILRTLPAVLLLRRAAPRAQLVWVCEEKWRAVLDRHPDLDEIVGMPRKDWQELARSVADWPRLLRSIAAFRRRLRLLGAQLVIDFHGNLRSGLTGWISGAPVRLGYDGHQQREGNRMFSTHRVNSGDRRTPRMERNLDLIRYLNISDAPLPDSLRLPMLDSGQEAASKIRGELPGGGSRFVILSPGASAAQAYKKPPGELLAAAARHLSQRGCTPLVVHGPGELEDARRVTEASAGAAILAPPTDLATLAALMSQARLFAGGDSGPLHLACAVGCPVVGIYGPTDPQVNQPWGVPWRAVYPAGRRYTGIKRVDRTRGFEGLEPEHVLASIDDLLGRGLG